MTPGLWWFYAGFFVGAVAGALIAYSAGMQHMREYRRKLDEIYRDYADQLRRQSVTAYGDALSEVRRTIGRGS